MAARNLEMTLWLPLFVHWRSLENDHTPNLFYSCNMLHSGGMPALLYPARFASCRSSLSCDAKSYLAVLLVGSLEAIFKEERSVEITALQKAAFMS